MIEHRDFQEDIPAYLAGRLDEDRSQRLETHMQDCRECADLVDDLKIVARGLRAGGPALLEPCPESAALMRCATGSEPDVDGRIARHLESCASCGIEFDVWKEKGRKAVRSPRRTVSRPVLYRWAGMAAAAGLVLGLGLPALFQVTDTGIETVPDTSGTATWSGPANLYTLDGTMRGDAGRTVFDVDHDQPYVPLVLLPELPGDAAGDEIFTFLITGENGIETWSTGISVDEIGNYLDLSGVLTLMVPIDRLAAGDYLMTVNRSGTEDETPVLQERFSIR